MGLVLAESGQIGAALDDANVTGNAAMVRDARTVWNQLDQSDKQSLRSLIADMEYRSSELAANPFTKLPNPLTQISPQLDAIFVGVAGADAKFRVEGVVDTQSYETIRSTVENGAVRLGKQDASIGATRGNHVSLNHTSPSGVALQRMADHYSRYQAGLNNARQEIVEAISIVVD